MAFVNATFPNPGLIHGIEKTLARPTTIVGNSAIESRLQKLQHYRSRWNWPSRGMEVSKRDTVFNFVTDTMGFSKNSVKFKDPLGSKWNNTALAYGGSSNLFKLTVRGGTDSHPVFHIDADVTVTVDGSPAGFTKSIVNGVPYLAVTGATGASVVRVSGTFYYAVRLDQATIEYTNEYLTLGNLDAGGIVGDISLIEVFEY